MLKYLISAILSLISATGAIASVRYDYKGVPVGTNSINLFSPSDLVTGYFVLAYRKLSGNFAATDFLDYDMQIGLLSLGKAEGADVGAHFVFDRRNNLISWSLVVGKYGAPSYDPSLIEVWSNSSDLLPSGDRINVYQGGRSQLGAVSLPGTWVLASPVPELNSGVLVLLGATVLGLWLLRRRTDHVFFQEASFVIR